MKPVRWGIIGVANIFQKAFLLPMQNSEMVELYGIASRNPEKAKKASETFGIPHYYPSYEALLADKSIDAVYIPLPNHLHLEWIKKAADAGKHILCEKPLTLNAGESREAIEYTKKKRVLLMEAFMYRFHPQWIRAKEIVDSANLGAVRAVHTFFSYSNNDPKNIRNILETGGGAIYDIGCYAVSAARYFFGKEPARVISLINRDPEFKTDILTSGMLDFGEGHSVFTVGTQTFPCQRVDIIGSAGRIHIRIPFNTFTADQYELQIERFSEAIRTGGQPPTPPEDALKNMGVLDALFRSEKSGNWEKVQT